MTKCISILSTAWLLPKRQNDTNWLYVQIGLKSQVLKNQILAISCPTPLFCLSCKLQGIEPWSTAALPITDGPP